MRSLAERLRPAEYVGSIYDIDYDALWQKGIRTLFFDVDNTLFPFDVNDPPVTVQNLLCSLKKKGFEIAILSNGRKERVAMICQKLGIKNGSALSAKPLLIGYKKLQKKLGTPPEKIAIIGDQLYMDSGCAARSHSYGILTKPISLEHDEVRVKKRRRSEAKLISQLGIRPVYRSHKNPNNKVWFGVNGHTELLGVFGDPVAHTLSPVIHQILVDHTKDNFVYAPFHVVPERLEDAVKGAFAMGYRGINCTIPHKQAVMKYLVELDASAELIGAVNTLKRTEKGFVGYNTDIDGFSKLCKINQVPVKGRKVLILGAGGAAHSALAVAYLMGASEIVIANRTEQRARDLMHQFSDTIRNRNSEIPKMRVITIKELEGSGENALGYEAQREEFPIVFQTTSAGMYPKTDTLPVNNDVFYSSVRYGLDMVFNPSETAFMKKVRANKGKAAGGLPMLFYQGVRAYEIWTGKKFTESETEAMFQKFMDEAAKWV